MIEEGLLVGILIAIGEMRWRIRRLEKIIHGRADRV